MNGFYQFTTKIKDTLKLDPFVNTVTYGDIFQVDLNKKTIFPLSHLVVNNVTKESNVMRFNISILAMDIVDVSKEATTDVFIGNDNTQDIWHTQLKVLDRLTELLRRGSIVSEGYQLDGNPTFEQFTERFENYLAGWTVTFDVLVGNDMTICEVGSSGSSCSPAGYIVTDSNGTQIYNGTIASGEVGTIVINDSTVENSDGSYSASVLAEGILVLPDITIDVTNSALTLVNTATVASVQDVTISAPDGTINIKKTGDGTIISQSVPSGVTIDYSVADNNITVNSGNAFTIDATDPLNIVLTDGTSSVAPTSVTYSQGQHKVDIVLPPNVQLYNSAELTKTGQTTSYRTGDDGDLEKGRGLSFFTLSNPNIFGNTNRFTDELGGQTYAKNIVIDWSTYSGSKVLGYYRRLLNTGGVTYDFSWNDAIDKALAHSVTGFTSGWRLWNKGEVDNIVNLEYSNGFAPPFDNASGGQIETQNLWTSSTLKISTTQAWYTQFYGSLNYGAKSGSRRVIAVRDFTVTGTTLS